MGKCSNCGVQFTLKNEEIICDNCKEIVNYPCHNCKRWFEILDDENQRIKECLVCGFFVCPYCSSCGVDCNKIFWEQKIRNIFEMSVEQDLKIKLICDYIQEIKIGKEQKLCPKKVPLSYAKGRIKSCLVRTLGMNTKSILDKEKFQQRLNNIFDLEEGTTFVITEKREEGSYGLEYRDVINTAICYGKIKASWEKRKDGLEYLLYTKINSSPCPKLDDKNLLFRFCPNCKTQFDNLSLEFCPHCQYKKTTNKHSSGEPKKLILKISNKDTCQLNRGAFVKRKRNGKGNG